MSNLPAVPASEKAIVPADAPPYVARAAICFMAVADEGNDVALYNRLIQVLRQDPRVDTVDAPSASSQEFTRLILNSVGFSEDDESQEEEEAPNPFSHMHAFNFALPIILQVRSPRRLQRTYGGFRHIPSDVYWAAWDGLTLAVLWEPEKARGGSALRPVGVDDLYKSLSPSGGLLVQDILEDASQKCGNAFETIACSTNCGYTFTHSDLVINTVGEEGETLFHNEGEQEDDLVYVDLAALHEPKWAVGELHHALGFTGRVFARIRSDGRTMEYAAWLAQRDTARLLRLNYERAVLSAKPFWKTVKTRWQTRKWRREARTLIARVCLDLATLERARSDWSRAKHLYEQVAPDHNSGVVFEHEYNGGVGTGSTLEVAEARAAIERVTGSLDNRALVIATALGAIVGALIGALVGSLL